MSKSIRLYVWASLVGILFFFGFRVFHDISHQCTRFEVVQSVGGCNFSGMCSVTFNSGQTGTLFMPTIGQNTCEEYRWKDIKNWHL